MKTQILLLSLAQALFQTATVIVMTVGAIAGNQIAPTPGWATAPIAAMLMGTALATFPASLLMARFGRRAGFLLGAGSGMLGGLVAAFGVHSGSLPILSLGTLFIGAYQGFAQFYRFAASEVASDAFRPRAISLVMAGGVIAAIMGPWLARLGGPLFPTDYLGSFLIIAVVSLLACGLLSAVKVPRQIVQTGEEKGRSLFEIVRQPAYLVALFGAVTGSGVMVFAMTATPLAMHHHHHDLSSSAMVIQLHVLGMFVPSFFSGGLITRFGVLNVMLAGVGLLGGHVLLTLSGTGFYSFASALVFLGLGWNFLFIGGTSLLTDTYAPHERGHAQAFNDMTIFAAALAGSLSAGALLELLGWQTMNLALVPWLLLAALAISWLAFSRRMAAMHSASTAPVSMPTGH